MTATLTESHALPQRIGGLATLARNSYGPLLLGVVAAGLVAFGIHSLSDARYRRL